MLNIDVQLISELENSTEDTPGLATGLASRVAASSRGEQAEDSILGLVIVWVSLVSLPTDSAERELKQTDDAQDCRAVLYQLSSSYPAYYWLFLTHSWYLWHSAQYRSLKEEENRYTWHLYFPGPLSLVNKQVNCDDWKAGSIWRCSIVLFNVVQSVLSNKYLIRVGGSKLRFYVRWIFHKMQNHIRRRERSFLYRFFWLQEPGRCLFCLHCSCSECFLSLHCLPVLWWRRWPRWPKVIITGIQSLKFFECQKICLFYENYEDVRILDWESVYSRP